jgi:hypothetical protein
MFVERRSVSPPPRRDTYSREQHDDDAEYPDSEEELKAQVALAEAEANAAKLRLRMMGARNRKRG